MPNQKHAINACGLHALAITKPQDLHHQIDISKLLSLQDYWGVHHAGLRLISSQSNFAAGHVHKQYII